MYMYTSHVCMEALSTFDDGDLFYQNGISHLPANIASKNWKINDIYLKIQYMYIYIICLKQIAQKLRRLPSLISVVLL